MDKWVGSLPMLIKPFQINKLLSQAQYNMIHSGTGVDFCIIPLTITSNNLRSTAMKPTLLLLLFLLFYSCKKELTIEEKLLGKWELRTSYNGWTGATTTYSSGNGNIREFTRTTYSRYSNGQIDETGTYAIVRDTIWGQLADRIIYNGFNGFPESFLSLEGNNLRFYSIIVGSGGQYERIK